MLDDKLNQSEKAELLTYIESYLFKTPQRTLIAVFDSAGAGLVTGIAGDVKIDYNCQVFSWTLTGDAAGSIVVDIWRSDYANFPPVLAGSITGDKPPYPEQFGEGDLEGVDRLDDENPRGDHLRFKINSVSGLNRVTLTLELRGP